MTSTFTIQLSPPVELRDQEVVILHPERELLHVYVVDGAVGGAEQEEVAGGVVGADGGQLLGLPVLGQRVPHADTPWVHHDIGRYII